MPVQRVTHDRYVLIRQSYLDLCDGHYAAAALLHVFEYRTRWIVEQNEHNREANRDRYEKDQPPLPINRGRWFYRTLDDLVRDIRGLRGRTKVIEGLALLERKGFIESTKEESGKKYRLRVDILNEALSHLSYEAPDKQDDPNAPDPIGEDVAANYDEVIALADKPYAEICEIESDEVWEAVMREKYNIPKRTVTYLYREDQWQFKWAAWWWTMMKERERLTVSYTDCRSNKEASKMYTLQRWADCFDQCIRNRGLTKDELKLVIFWLFNVDDFWINEAGMSSPNAFHKKKDDMYRIEYMLIKARDWNEGRNGRLALPEHNEEVPEHVVEKYKRQYGDDIIGRFRAIGFGTGRDSDKKVYRYKDPEVV